MARAVRLHEYGDVDVLRVEDVDPPTANAGEVVVRVHAAGINPGEAKIRSGALHAMWPSSFPSGQGSDLAGVIDSVGDGVTGFSVGDEVIGWSDQRSSQAELVRVPVSQLTPKPAAVPWEVAGSLFVTGTTAWATVRAVGLSRRRRCRRVRRRGWCRHAHRAARSPGRRRSDWSGRRPQSRLAA